MTVLGARAVVCAVVSAVVCALACDGTCSARGTPLGSSFTYQGVLKSGASPYSGSADMRFSLFDGFAAGSQIGSTIEITNVAVIDGVFTADLYFNSPNAFNGEARWLAIEVRAPAGGGAYVPLTPRQQVTAAPYALYAVNANTPFTYSAGNAIFTSGNVGIGTMTPSVRLEVTGGRALIGDGPADEDAKLTVGSDFSDDFTYGGTALAVGDASNASINVGTSVNNWLSLGTSAGLGYPLIAANGPGGVAIRTNGTDRIRITGTGDVGIGTDSPIARLQVAGGLAIDGDFGSLSLLGIGQSLSARMQRLDLAGAGLMISDFKAGPIQFATSPIVGAAGERMRIGADGNVGIGTTTPITRLHVAGGLAIDGDFGSLSLLGIGQSLSARMQRLDLAGAGLMLSDFKAGPIQFATSPIMGAAGERMRVAADGNVGIGSSSPQRLLHLGNLAGPSTAMMRLESSNGTNFRTFDVGVPTVGDINTGAAYSFVMDDAQLGSTPEFILKWGSGHVGIGTTSPATGLHVEGPGFPRAFVTIRSAGGNGDAGFRLDRDASTFWHIFNSAPAGDVLNIRNSGFGLVLAATQAGNVGIGTDAPGSFRLAVNGTAANSTGSWSIFSDERLKTNIRDLPEGTLDRLLALRGRTFEYTREAQRRNLALPGVQTGFIAQEVQEVFPEWVDRNADDYLFITERGTTALLVEALRELRSEKDSQISALSERVAALTETNSQLQARLAALERLMLHQEMTEE